MVTRDVKKLEFVQEAVPFYGPCSRASQRTGGGTFLCAMLVESWFCAPSPTGTLGCAPPQHCENVLASACTGNGNTTLGQRRNGCGNAKSGTVLCQSFLPVQERNLARLATFFCPVLHIMERIKLAGSRIAKGPPFGVLAKSGPAGAERSRPRPRARNRARPHSLPRTRSHARIRPCSRARACRRGWRRRGERTVGQTRWNRF